MVNYNKREKLSSNLGEMKIGIYTIHNSYNYGAMLQAYATQHVIEKMGFEVEFVHLYTKKQERLNKYSNLSLNIKSIASFLFAQLNLGIKKRIRNYNRFLDKFKLSKRFLTFEDLKNEIPCYDIHLVGSDQVWNLESGFPSIPVFFLEFIGSHKTKISYASSFGGVMVSANSIQRLKSSLIEFSNVSVREESAVNIISKYVGIQSKQVLDPTFLVNSNEWDEILEKPKIEGDYILCYGFDGSSVSKEMLLAIKKRLNLPIIVVSVSLFFPFKVDKFIRSAGPKEFLGLIKYAKFICSGSYHGMALAINFRKSFFGTKHPTRNSRMQSMLSKFGLEHRQLECPKDILNMNDNNLFIDYTKHEIKINEAINDSYLWLVETLKSYSK